MKFLQVWSCIALVVGGIVGVTYLIVGSIQLDIWAFDHNYSVLGWGILFIWGTFILTILSGPRD